MIMAARVTFVVQWEMSRHRRPGRLERNPSLQLGFAAQAHSWHSGAGMGQWPRRYGPTWDSAQRCASAAPWACSCRSLQLGVVGAPKHRQQRASRRGWSRLARLVPQVNLLALLAAVARCGGATCVPASSWGVGAWPGISLGALPPSQPPALPPARLLQGYLVCCVCDGAGRRAHGRS